MLQAILVKSLPATNTKNYRLSAQCCGGRVVITWNDELEKEENHIRAAKLLAIKMGWTGNFYGGVIKSGDSVFVHSNAPSFRL
jgi:hypothetical protein